MNLRSEALSLGFAPQLQEATGARRPEVLGTWWACSARFRGLLGGGGLGGLGFRGFRVQGFGFRI